MAVTYKLIVNLNSNGGSSVSSVSATYIGDPVNKTLSVTPTAKPTRTGYTFKGWSPSTVSVTIYSATSQTVTKSSTAQWSINTYSVSYNANGGAGAPSAQVKTYGKTLKLTTNVPVREGYDFVSWNTERDGDGTTYMPGQSYTSNSKLSLYAQWELATYKLTYDANGGDGAPERDQCLPGESITISDVVPVRPHYDFNGWAFVGDASQAVLHAGDTYTPSRDVTLFAVWTQHQYRLNLNAGAGVVTPAYINCTYGSKVGALPTPDYPGNTFAGWYDGDDIVTGETVFLYDDDHIVNAAWTANTIHVTFSGNGAAIGSLSHDYVFGGTFDYLPAPSRWGYVLMGWATDKEGTRLIHQGATVELTKDCVLYAIWQAMPAETVDYGFVWVRENEKMKLHKVLQKQDGRFVRHKTIIM